MTPIDLTIAQESSILGRANPLVKLGLALAWLVGLAVIRDPARPLMLAVIVAAAALAFGHLRPARLLRALAPLLVAAAAIALANLVFAAVNTDPGAREVARIGPVRLTAAAFGVAAAVGARVLAIVVTGVVFAQTTDPTRLVDALVQQGRVPERFAYGALAAYQAVPGLGQDLVTLRHARRVRGLSPWHPRLLVGLLVRAIRHADQLALAMDARGFGSGPRTSFRPIAWHPTDLLVGLAGIAILALLVIF